MLLLIEDRSPFKIVPVSEQPPKCPLAIDHGLGAVRDRHDRQHIAMALAAALITTSMAFPRPRVSVVCTGVGLHVPVRRCELGLVLEKDDELAMGCCLEAEIRLRLLPVVVGKRRGRLGGVLGIRTRAGR